MDRKEYIIKYIKTKLNEFQSLGKFYSEEKINSLADRLTNSDKSLEDVCILIDNKFEHQLRKTTHNHHLESIKQYYLSSIDKLKNSNNCYLLSYSQGIKLLEQACVKEKGKKASPYIEVIINNKKKGFKRENNDINDYELIRSEIAYLLDVPFMKTYRIFDEAMNPQGIVKESALHSNERILDLEETLQFVKEESSKFTAKQELIAYHDKQKKRGLKDIPTKKEYKVNIEYVLNLFKLLPDINMSEYNKLKKEYLRIIIFSLLTDNKEMDPTSIGIVINKENPKYTYTISPLFKKETKEIMLPDSKTICNFFIVDKKELFHTLVVNYYEDIKQLLTLLLDNQETLMLIINQVIKEHLEYDDYINYKKQVETNLNLICDEVICKKAVSPDTEEDQASYKINNDNYLVKIEPFFESENKEEEEKGSAAIVAVIGIVLVVTILLIIAAIYAVSKVEI